MSSSAMSGHDDVISMEGMPAIYDYAYILCEDWERAVEDATQAAADVLQQAVSERASHHPMWGDGPRPAVWAEDGDLVVGVFGSEQEVEAARTLEYGSDVQQIPPSGLLHMSLLSQRHRMGQVFEQVLNEGHVD